MSEESEDPVGPALTRYALAFGVGLLMMGWVALRLVTTAYVSANPNVGDPSPSAVFWVFNIALFLGGAALAFLAAYTALYEVLRETGY
jgi:hypothetical protein